MTSVTWKSAEILKVFGTTIREGTFTGSKIYPTGVTTPDSPTTFTPAKIAKIYENITTHVPIYLGHSSDESNRKPIGYAYKFGVTETLDDIKYNGFVFDPDAMRRIVTEGWDKVSPETSQDDTQLLALAFVPNPAITGTEADMEIKLFSQGETKPTTGMTETASSQGSETATQQAQVKEQTVSKPTETQQVVKETVIKEQAPDVSALVSQVEDYKNKYERAEARAESLLNQQYDVLVGEMKGLGYADPAALVRGLTVEQKISVLSKLKEGIVISKPLAETTKSTTDDTSKINTALEETLKELGISESEYNKIAGKK